MKETENIEVFLQNAFQVILQRPIDDAALQYYKDQLLSGTISKLALVETLFSGFEFKMLKSNWNQVVHQSRLEYVSLLPSFQHILDIGGSSSNIQEGALIEMGYQFAPESIDILDLPEEEQYWGKPKFPQDRDYSILDGKCVLHYEHARVEKVDELPQMQGKKYDMVFMGQVIEHIQPESLDRVLKWIHQALKADGYFIFDTPNRAATRLINPQGYIDGDHKKEYTPDELRKVLKKNHFTIYKEYGLVNMSKSIQKNSFDPLEESFCNGGKKLVDQNADNGYLFAFICKV